MFFVYVCYVSPQFETSVSNLACTWTTFSEISDKSNHRAFYVKKNIITKPTDSLIYSESKKIQLSHHFP